MARWRFAALTTIEVPVLALWFVNLSGGKGTKPSEALRRWSGQRLAELDGWLANSNYVATDECTSGLEADPRRLRPAR